MPRFALTPILAVAALAVLTACSTNTAQGVRQDARVVTDKTTDVAKRAASATVKGVGKVTRKTGEALSRGGEKLEDAVSD